MGHKAVAGGLSLLGGAGIGAVLMYLFDPEKGSQRRSAISSAANAAAQGAGETLSKAWQEVSSHASELKDHIAEHARDLTDHARHLKDHVTESAGNSAADLSDRIQQKAMEYAASAREYAESYLQPETHGSGTGYTMTAVGALALGLGAMYLLDPAKGKDRRESLFATAHDAIGEAGSAARSAGNFVRAQFDRALMEVNAYMDDPHEEDPAEASSSHWNTTSRIALGLTGGALGFYGAVRRDWVGLGAGALGLGLIAAGLAKYDFSQIGQAAQHVREAASRMTGHETPTSDPAVSQP